MPRVEWPDKPIPARESGLVSADYISAAVKAYERARQALLKPIPNLDPHGSVKVSIDVEDDNPWNLRFWNNSLQITTTRPGTLTRIYREIHFDPSSSYGGNVSYTREGKNRKAGPSGMNKPWVLELANQDLDFILKPAEEATQIVIPFKKPETIEKQLKTAPQRARRALLRDFPNFVGASFELLDENGLRWSLSFRKDLVFATQYSKTGSELDQFRVAMDKDSEPFVYYSLRAYRRRKEIPKNTELEKEITLQRLSELLTPAEKASGRLL